MQSSSLLPPPAPQTLMAGEGARTTRVDPTKCDALNAVLHSPDHRLYAIYFGGVPPDTLHKIPMETLTTGYTNLCLFLWSDTDRRYLIQSLANAAEVNTCLAAVTVRYENNTYAGPRNPANASLAVWQSKHDLAKLV